MTRRVLQFALVLALGAFLTTAPSMAQTGGPCDPEDAACLLCQVVCYQGENSCDEANGTWGIDCDDPGLYWDGSTCEMDAYCECPPEGCISG
jgi:hypothetical protein